jgi:malonate transporter
MSMTLAVLPVALILACGYLAAATGMVPRENWDAVETLAFRVLFPAVLIASISRAEFEAGRAGGMLTAVIGALVLTGFTVLALRRWLPDPAVSSMFQTTTRWNAFIALALAELTGRAGASGLIALSMAVLIPLINVGNIVVVAGLGHGRATTAGVAKAIVKNPLVIGSVLGIAAHVTGYPGEGPVGQALEMIGRGAIGVGLLVIGASIRPQRLLRPGWRIWLGVALRLVAVPGLFFALAWAFGLGPVAVLAGLLVTGVPTAANGYVVARQMGGDAGLYAEVLSWQTLLCLLTLPVWLRLAG